MNALAPAYFPTEMTTDPRIGEVPPDHVEVMRKFTPMDRLGRLEEIETAVLFLASPKSSYVTGVDRHRRRRLDGLVRPAATEPDASA